MNNQEQKNQARNFFVDYFVPVIIAIGIAIVSFGDMPLITHRNSDTFRTFNSLSSGLDDYYEFKTAWKPRLFSNALAAWAVRVSEWVLTKTSLPMVKQPLDLVVGMWTAGWFMLTCFFFIWFLKRRAVFYIFGLYAGISYGYLSGLRVTAQAYPWDMPALFFFSVFVLLFLAKKYWLIFFLIPLAMGFKETSIVLVFAFLFADLPRKQRLSMLIGTAALSFAVKVGIDIFTHAPLLFTMETSVNNENERYLLSNLRVFTGLFPYFINAGTLLIFLAMPGINKNILYMKLISIPFILGILLFGIADEYRIWFELIPFSLYAIDTAIYGEPINQMNI